MEFQDMNILFIVIFSVIILTSIGIFIVVIASIFSPKFQGKMMGKQIKATKYMIDETKDDMMLFLGFQLFLKHQFYHQRKLHL